MLLADAMALQFSRPLFMIPLAVFLLGETVRLRRTVVAAVGFAGIVLYARPFSAVSSRMRLSARLARLQAWW
jgi:drug/metabolite transporter (DMT)-like permease